MMLVADYDGDEDMWPDAEVIPKGAGWREDTTQHKHTLKPCASDAGSPQAYQN